ncbi:DUF5651 domain-containing protein [Sporomusa aerivorans]|uniref:DUF5651 domain-containing protein n=1 Tax=Sporomusa aerivorans TaxID=204936 RepID=UPI00352AEEAD
MNPYFSRQEKENFIRLMILEAILDVIIEDYEKANKPDKQFMADMRRARTYTTKALNRRQSFLDQTAKLNFMESMQRLEVLFVPKNEAKKHFQEVAKLQSMVSFEAKDFKDWYEFLIEHACRTCTRKDFGECQARRILMKHDIYAYNPAAVQQCQYSYVEADNEQQGLGTVGEALLKATKMKGGVA